MRSRYCNTRKKIQSQNTRLITLKRVSKRQLLRPIVAALNNYYSRFSFFPGNDSSNAYKALFPLFCLFHDEERGLTFPAFAFLLLSHLCCNYSIVLATQFADTFPFFGCFQVIHAHAQYEEEVWVQDIIVHEHEKRKFSRKRCQFSQEKAKQEWKSQQGFPKTCYSCFSVHSLTEGIQFRPLLFDFAVVKVVDVAKSVALVAFCFTLVLNAFLFPDLVNQKDFQKQKC